MSWFLPQITSQPPAPRASHTSTVLSESKVFVFGGDDGKGALYNDAYLFDISTIH